jgi:hypothetical protein
VVRLGLRAAAIVSRVLCLREVLMRHGGLAPGEVAKVIEGKDVGSCRRRCAVRWTPTVRRNRGGHSGS